MILNLKLLEGSSSKQQGPVQHDRTPWKLFIICVFAIYLSSCVFCVQFICHHVCFVRNLFVIMYVLHAIYLSSFVFCWRFCRPPQKWKYLHTQKEVNFRLSLILPKPDLRGWCALHKKISCRSGLCHVLGICKIHFEIWTNTSWSFNRKHFQMFWYLYTTSVKFHI